MVIAAVKLKRENFSHALSSLPVIESCGLNDRSRQFVSIARCYDSADIMLGSISQRRRTHTAA
jgi:hypothetical protein